MIVLGFLIGAAIFWVFLLATVAVARNWADLGIISWPNAMWRLAIVAAVVYAVMLAAGQIHWITGLSLGFLALWITMAKLFQADALGAIVIGVVLVLIMFATNLVLNAMLG